MKFKVVKATAPYTSLKTPKNTPEYAELEAELLKRPIDNTSCLVVPIKYKAAICSLRWYYPKALRTLFTKTEMQIWVVKTMQLRGSKTVKEAVTKKTKAAKTAVAAVLPTKKKMGRPVGSKNIQPTE